MYVLLCMTCHTKMFLTKQSMKTKLLLTERNAEYASNQAKTIKITFNCNSLH